MIVFVKQLNLLSLYIATFNSCPALITKNEIFIFFICG